LDELKKREEDVSVLLIDANFSPVLNVKYEISDTRFGDITNLDSLQMTVTTNGIISPVDALKFS
jgi:DNA-directed RNA polymerase subunit alpha